MRKGSIAVASLVLISSIFVGMSLVPNAKGSTLYVGGFGPGNYTTIQSAINAANPGDTVFVYNGRYYENLYIAESIHLTGEDRDSTIIDGGGSGTVTFIDSAGVSVERFTITNSGHEFMNAAIRAYYALDCHINNSRISHSGKGIISQGGGGCIIANSIIQKNNGDGIYLEESGSNWVYGNTIVDNGGGIGVGYLGSSGNVIEGNLISSNGAAIGMGGPPGMMAYGNFVFGNTISHNSGGIFLINSFDNSISSNNFIANGWQTSVGGTDLDYCPHNAWGGNYWSDYSGTDDDGDGFGDTPYEIVCISAMGNRHYDYDYSPRMKRSVPIGGLELDGAALSGEFLEHLHLRWSTSPGSRPVKGFQIHRGSIFDAHGSGYELVASLPISASTYTDIGAGEGNPGIYFYRVCALDIYNDEICAANQAAKFTRFLGTGPSLISIPLVDDNKSIEKVLRTVDFDKAWFYDSFGREWKSYARFKTYDTPHPVNRTMGVWINVTKESNLTVAGIVPAQTTIKLNKGWNLVGFPSFDTSFTVADLKAIAPVDRVEAFDASAAPHLLRVLEDSEVLSAGQGYWVMASGRASWMVSNP